MAYAPPWASTLASKMIVIAERAEGEDQYQGSYGPGPVWSHSVAGQVARDEVEHAGHG